MSDPKIIYLGPACQKEGDGREWCEDDVWPQCECGCSSVRYMLESDAQSELSALREELARVKGISDNYYSLLVDANQSLAAAEQRNTTLEATLKFYADGDHLLLADPDEWDTCSGEPINWLHDAAGTASVEDGSIAKQALNKPTESGASE